jgi:flagellar basal body-associated protein FliL
VGVTQSRSMKALILLLLVGILAALAGAGVFMLRRPAGTSDGATTQARDPKAMARALALRVALSVSLFLLVLLAWAMGWIKPTGLPMT